MRKRSPYWKWLRACSHKIIAVKKGRGSYTRKIKHKEKTNDHK